MMKYLDQNGLLYLWQKLKTLLAGKVDKVDGKGLSANDYTTEEKQKLANIASGANNYTHPTTSGNKHIPAGGASGQILRWSADGTAVWGADNNTTYSEATTEKSGLLSASDKMKLNGIEEGANKTTVDSALSATSTNPVQNKAMKAALDGKEEIFTKNTAFNKNFGAAAGTVCQGNDARLSDARPANGGNSSTVNGHSVLSDVPANAVFTDTKYSVATASNDGLMSKADFAKLSGFSAASNYALKSDITGVYKYKGSKATEADLPTTGNTLGDVWNVETDGQNYAWDGQKWDGLGGVFEIVSITNAEIDTIFAS